jgi:hypothetical protein
VQAGAPGPAGGGLRGGPAGPPPNPGYPRGYKVETSLNGTAWTPVAIGEGLGPATTITFKPTQAKFIKLTQTATMANLPPFSITNLRVFEQPKGAGK